MQQESFARFAEPLRSNGIEIVHVLLESTREIIHDRILERGESEDCWCARHIDECLSSQWHFEGVIRVQSVDQTLDELAKEVIQGKWGNGDDRRQKLTQAGYDYNAVQAEVNSILR